MGSSSRPALRATRLVLAACALWGACGTSDADGEGSIVASVYPLEWAAARIAGGLSEVTNVTPAGAEPHDVELTSDDLDALEDAAVVLYIGGGFQPAVEEVAERREEGTLDVAQAAGGGDDPHVWLDPRRFADAVDRIADTISRGLGERDGAAVADAAADLEADLRALDDEMRRGLSRCERRSFVTMHDAFGHLARRYDLEVFAVAGIAPESEPDAARIRELAELVESRGITRVFAESAESEPLARTLARDAGVATGLLHTLETLPDDRRRAGDDYLDLMRANLAALRDALGCT